MKDGIKKQNGVTLIALAVTIIVLAILAGVSISALTSEKNVVKEAKGAKLESQQQSVKEKVQVAVTASIKKDGTIDKTLLNRKLGTTITEFPATITIEDVNLTITEDGEVSLTP